MAPELRKLTFHRGCRAQAVGVPSIDAVMLGFGIDHIVHALSRDTDIGHIEW